MKKWANTPACLAALILGLGQCAVLAQGASDKGTPGMNASMSKWFGNNTNFIAKVEARVLDKSQQEITSMPMGLEMLGGSVRVEINMAQVKSREMTPDFAATMKQMGMDQMTTILMPEKKLILTIYPGLKAYAESAMPKEEIQSAAQDYKSETNRLGKETVDGHPCDKDDVTLTDDKGAKQKALVWHATDLKGFPLQMQLVEDDTTIIMKFKDVKLGRPDNSHFAAPTGMSKFDSVNALMSDVITKKMNAAGPK